MVYWLFENRCTELSIRQCIFCQLKHFLWECALQRNKLYTCTCVKNVFDTSETKTHIYFLNIFQNIFWTWKLKTKFNITEQGLFKPYLKLCSIDVFQGADPGTVTSIPPNSFQKPHDRFQAGLEQIQSQHHMDFQPPMPRPPMFSTWWLADWFHSGLEHIQSQHHMEFHPPMPCQLCSLWLAQGWTALCLTYNCFLLRYCVREFSFKIEIYSAIWN